MVYLGLDGIDADDALFRRHRDGRKKTTKTKLTIVRGGNDYKDRRCTGALPSCCLDKFFGNVSFIWKNNLLQ